MVQVTPFVENPCEIAKIENSKAYIIRQKINNGEKLTNEEKEYITRAAYESIYFKDSIAVMGWRIPFNDVLKTYLYKQYGQWQEIKAINKSCVRSVVYGRIDKIICLDEIK